MIPLCRQPLPTQSVTASPTPLNPPGARIWNRERSKFWNREKKPERKKRFIRKHAPHTLQVYKSPTFSFQHHQLSVEEITHSIYRVLSPAYYYSTQIFCTKRGESTSKSKPWTTRVEVTPARGNRGSGLSAPAGSSQTKMLRVVAEGVAAAPGAWEPPTPPQPHFPQCPHNSPPHLPLVRFGTPPGRTINTFFQ